MHITLALVANLNAKWGVARLIGQTKNDKTQAENQPTVKRQK